MLDEVMMKAINMANDKNYPEEATLMFELIGTGLVPVQMGILWSVLVVDFGVQVLLDTDGLTF